MCDCHSYLLFVDNLGKNLVTWSQGIGTDFYNHFSLKKIYKNYRNSIPPTTTVENLNIKRNVARGKIFVDVAFWGGVIPGNEDELCAMVNEGVVGFKCFLCPSGVPEFPNVNANEVEIALQKLQNTDAVLAVG